MRAFVAMAVMLVVSAGLLLPARHGSAADSPLVLIVGGQDEMKTRNPLPAIANDMWTTDVLNRVYESVLLTHPTENGPIAWIAKGVDFDEDGTFEIDEYDVFAERASAITPLEIVIYYDFNGVRWHDGVQMTPWDLFFSYHVNGQNSRFNTDMRVLFPNPAGYEAGGRQLNVGLVGPRSWEGERTMFGGQNNPLRIGVRFTLETSFELFYESTIAPVMMPMHIWSRMGGGRHATSDFGCAVWIPPAEATARGIPECAPSPDDPSKYGKGIGSGEVVTGSRPYSYSSAEGWALTNADVIGHGPFTFGQWVPGIEASVVRYEGFYTGVDGTTVYDARLASILTKPTIEGIRYKVYRTTQLGVFALQAGEIDFYHWNVGAEFVPDLLKIPEIAVESNAEPGYFYMGYNMRDSPWGYEDNNNSNDVGYWLRKAIPHLADKASMVFTYLLNGGVAMHGFISPANLFWYDDGIPKPRYDLEAAAAILDDPARGGAAGIGPDPPGLCNKDNDAGCRSLPGVGNAEFEILSPLPGYGWGWDPSGMIADSMRRVGLNAMSVPTAAGTLSSRIINHDFSLYVARRTAGVDPDYLFDFFHSSNAAAGPNYGGFNSTVFDAFIEASRLELSRDARRGLISQAHEVLLDARPAEPLFARSNVEAYRQDRFINWTVRSGTIWNEWSLLGIRPPIPSSERLYVQMTLASAMVSDALEGLTATVLDPRGLAVPGARVTLTVNSGVLTLGGSSGLTVESVTNANAQVFATFRAPVVGSATMVLLTGSASHPDFHDSLLLTNAVWIYPLGERFLSLRFELPLGDLVSPGNSLPLFIEVRNQDNALVPDAVLGVSSTNESLLRPSRTNGTATELAAIVVEALGPLDSAASAAIVVNASMPDYPVSEASVAIHVLPTARTHRCPTGEIVRASEDCPPPRSMDDAAPLILAMGILIVGTAVAGLLIIRRRR